MLFRREPIVQGPIVDFAKLAEAIERETRDLKQEAFGTGIAQYVPPKARSDRFEDAREVSLNEVGQFRDLSLAELDRLLEQVEADRAKLLRMAKIFRENIERGHKLLTEEIERHAERCRAANEFFVRFKSHQSEMPATPPAEKP